MVSGRRAKQIRREEESAAATDEAAMPKFQPRPVDRGAEPIGLIDEGVFYPAATCARGHVVVERGIGVHQWVGVTMASNHFWCEHCQDWAVQKPMEVSFVDGLLDAVLLDDRGLPQLDAAIAVLTALPPDATIDDALDALDEEAPVVADYMRRGWDQLMRVGGVGSNLGGLGLLLSAVYWAATKTADVDLGPIVEQGGELAGWLIRNGWPG